MEEKIHLTGELPTLAGHAPLAAMTPVGGEIRRPRDVWIEGDPRELLGPTLSWRQKLQERVTFEAGLLGLRIRFVMQDLVPQFDLLLLVGSVLEALPNSVDGLFLYAEFMRGSEEGLYLAFENRPPALVTQVWISNRKHEPAGTLQPVTGPIHLNVLLHEPAIGFQEIWNDGTLDYILERLQGLCGSTCSARANIHQFSLARSDSQKFGFSVGIESVGREQGSQGGPAV